MRLFIGLIDNRRSVDAGHGFRRVFLFKRLTGASAGATDPQRTERPAVTRSAVFRRPLWSAQAAYG